MLLFSTRALLITSADYNCFVQLIRPQMDFADVERVMRVLEQISVRDDYFTLSMAQLYRRGSV